MRLTPTERDIIKGVLQAADPAARVILFGSRVDDSKKGGDIDLLVLSHTLQFSDKLRLRSELFERLGEQKIDLVLAQDTDKPFTRLALQEGVEL